jgi:DNA-binding transcriptional regulator LsrR (DeoR family)
MIESGKAKNQSELAQLKDISRARITQILNLLKLDKNIITRIKIIGDPMERRIVSERQLRNLTKNY